MTTLTIARADLKGVVADLDEREYHAHHALSSTGARELLRAPLRFLHNQQAERAPKKAFDVGTFAHSKVLGTGAQAIVYPDGTGGDVFTVWDDEAQEYVEHDNVLAKNGAVSTALAKAFDADARARGLVPLKRAEYDAVNAMAESVLSHAGARWLLEHQGMPEASVFATDPATGVEERARFDWLVLDGDFRFGVDLKTVHGDATPHAFQRSVTDRGYHVQEAWYEDAAEAAGEPINDFAFIVVEKEPPYLTAVFSLDDKFREIGRERAKRAREVYAKATETGYWPGHPAAIQLVQAPMYEIYRHIDESEAAA
ncbi:hypothetical protein QE418_003435 [Microbacterium testaceum]|uniref:PD-(D/E)XK nuclease-like domain-containing protein n=1 Tax=Microbacterium TaxID=33882 RepID=UPI002786A663|nr:MULTISPECIES: PD-(D/E)XK nuclease-like domain-containing protein [Microbacterium]MDQ1113987.1 hypothetical protein [Microbacterium testaceum]MDR6098906.1 hypothetical protein [Microbacterium sp. SORGH_AS_0454]